MAVLPVPITPAPRIMTGEVFGSYLDRILGECRKQLASKGPEYTTGSLDRLRNFRANAERNPRLDSLDVAGVYWLKHVDSIINYIATRKPGSEPIEGRIADCINYLIFIGALIWEEENATN